MCSFRSISEICECIFDLEERHQLLDYEIGGVKLWQYLRMPMYYRVAEKSGVISAPHPNYQEQTQSSRLLKLLSQFRSALLYSPFSYSGSPDVLLVDHPRSTQYNNEHIDIYSHFLIASLLNEGKRVCIVEQPRNFSHIRHITPNRKHLDILYFYQKPFMMIRNSYPSRAIRKEIRVLDSLLCRELELNTSLYDLLLKGYIDYKVSYRFWRRLLIKQKPGKVILLVSYMRRGGLTKAAKDLNVEVLELQHGVFSPYHLGYSFPGRKDELDYFPDTFLSWGNYWSNLIDLPIPKSNVVDFGFEYFHRMKAQHNTLDRQKNQVLILSQGAISNALARVINQLSEELKSYHLIYKLHPNESATWRNNTDLVALSQLDNIDIIDYDCDLYKTFSESEYQMGVFSTAIFEGIGMGCKTILFDLAGIEYMEQLIQSNLAVLHENSCKLASTFRKVDSINTSDSTISLFGTSTEI